MNFYISLKQEDSNAAPIFAAVETKLSEMAKLRAWERDSIACTTFPFLLEDVAKMLGYGSDRRNNLKSFIKLVENIDEIPEQFVELLGSLMKLGDNGRKKKVLKYKRDFIIVENHSERRSYDIFFGGEGVYRWGMQGPTEQCSLIRSAFLALKQEFETQQRGQFQEMRNRIQKLEEDKALLELTVKELEEDKSHLLENEETALTTEYWMGEEAMSIISRERI